MGGGSSLVEYRASAKSNALTASNREAGSVLPFGGSDLQSTTLREVSFVHAAAIRPEGLLPPTEGSGDLRTDGRGLGEQPIHAGNQRSEVMRGHITRHSDENCNRCSRFSPTTGCEVRDGNRGVPSHGSVPVSPCAFRVWIVARRRPPAICARNVRSNTPRNSPCL